MFLSEDPAQEMTAFKNTFKRVPSDLTAELQRSYTVVASRASARLYKARWTQKRKTMTQYQPTTNLDWL